MEAVEGEEGYYKIKHVASALYVTVGNHGTDDGSKIMVEKYLEENEAFNGKFTNSYTDVNGSEWYWFTHMHPDKQMKVEGYDNENGTSLKQETGDKGSQQEGGDSDKINFGFYFRLVD